MARATQVETAHTTTAQQGYALDDAATGQPDMLTSSSDQDCAIVFDGLDNPVGLLTGFATNAFSYSYDPYGVQVLTAGGSGNGASQNPYEFHGGIQDRASGLVKFGIRWYNPTTGTWTQQDTLDPPLNPHNGNRYVFAGGDPTNETDPSGDVSGGELAEGCLRSAAFGGAIGVLGADETIVGLGVAPGVGCVVGAAGAAFDSATSSSDYEAADSLDEAVEFGTALGELAS